MPGVKMYLTEWCPYCQRARALLKQRGVTQIDEIDLDRAPQERGEMIRRSGRYTVPQIFIGDTHIGGCDDLMALDRQGRLASLLSAS